MSFRGPMALAYLLAAYLAVFVVHSADADDNGITLDTLPQERASNRSLGELLKTYNELPLILRAGLFTGALLVSGTLFVLGFAGGYLFRGFWSPSADRSIYDTSKEPLIGYDFGNDYGYDYYGGKNGVNRNYGGGLAPENNNFPNTDDRTKFPDFLDADKFSQYDAELEPLSYNPTGKKSTGYVNQRYKQA